MNNEGNNNFSGFKLHEREVKRYIDAISLTKSNQIGFPTSMFNEHHIERFDCAYLYWNAESSEIGVEFSNETNDKRTFKVIRSKNYGGYLSVSSFLMANKIDPSLYAGRYDYRVVKMRDLGADKDGAMFIFKIKRADVDGGAP